MKFLVLSDTHDSLEKVYDVWEKLKSQTTIDTIIHCGDFHADALEIADCTGAKIIGVKGNCDGLRDTEDVKIIETEAGNLLVTHGHTLNVDLGQQNLYYKVSEADCIGGIFGHTHRSSYLHYQGVHLMNPGSISRPRDGSNGTFGILEINGSTVAFQIYDYKDFMEKTRGKKEKKIRGGHLREMINYSDRF